MAATRAATKKNLKNREIVCFMNTLAPFVV